MPSLTAFLVGRVLLLNWATEKRVITLKLILTSLEKDLGHEGFGRRPSIFGETPCPLKLTRLEPFFVRELTTVSPSFPRYPK